MNYEREFLEALKSIFVGAKIEGESGFINLMKIKSSYYETGVFPHLMQDIAAACQPFEAGFRAELFDKLYAFFSRYFSESGSIYFRHTPLHQNVYERVYTDDRDVILFWKTHMLYYVKTDRLFQSLDAEVDGVKFYFDASALEHKRANEKRELVFEFSRVDLTRGLVLAVSYSERGRKTKSDAILKAARTAGLTLDPETLERALRVFEKQSEVDYFINKNAGDFLKEQFDLWLYQYVFSGETQFTENRLRQLQAIKDIACKIIDFIAQFEDELVRVWNKPKFVRGSHYVVTLDHLFAKGGEDFVRRLLEQPGMPAQMTEWTELGMLEDGFETDWLFLKDVVGEPRHLKYRYLPLDTRHFPEMELEIIGLFDDLDAALDGWLVHSENYQALNTFQPKFKGITNVIYIDPPFNTSASEIIYQNQFKRSSWLSLIYDRIQTASELMNDEAIICTAIDDFEVDSLKNCLNNIFNEDMYLATAIVRSNPHGRAMAAGFSQNHEFALFYAKSKRSNVGRLPRDEKRQSRYPEKDNNGSFAWMNFRATGANSRRQDRPKLHYPIYVASTGEARIPTLLWDIENSSWVPTEPIQGDEFIILPIDSDGSERVWNLGWERARELFGIELVPKIIDDRWQIYRKYRPNEAGSLPGTWWDDAKYSATESGTRIIKDLFGERELFSYPKSVFLVEDCLRASNASDGSLTLDFFAGSGTTAHAVMNLNQADGGQRKYILVEMGEHFETVILPRVKKVAFSDKWKDGKANEGKGMSHFVKYYALEQYEDTLRRASYADAALFEHAKDPYTSYVFQRDLKMLEAVDLDPDQNRVQVHLERLYPDIDLAETLSCITGKWIQRITPDTVYFQDGSSASLSDPDWSLIKPLVWW